jgi:hypothetical protein
VKNLQFKSWHVCEKVNTRIYIYIYFNTHLEAGNSESLSDKGRLASMKGGFLLGDDLSS